MLEEYQAEAQQVADNLQQSHDTLEALRARMHEEHPEEDRTYRMGKAMTVLGAVSVSLMQAMNQLQAIEWPTEDRPR